MKEHWKRVVGYEDFYAVSTHGRVFSFKKGQILKSRIYKGEKYPMVLLTVNGVKKDVLVHKLVLIAFRGPGQFWRTCQRLDGDPTNNHLSNLAWEREKIASFVGEIWRPVVGYEQFYSVSNFGRVVSRNNILLSQSIKSGGVPSEHYLRVEFWVGGDRKFHDVHKIVLMAFCGPRPTGQECRHLDGNRLNNRLDNLEWGTYWENRLDYRKHHQEELLTPDQVRYIRSSTKTLRALAAELGCCKSNVHLVRQRRIWADIPD